MIVGETYSITRLGRGVDIVTSLRGGSKIVKECAS